MPVDHAAARQFRQLGEILAGQRAAARIGSASANAIASDGHCSY
ncbi:MAG TPA: hypothetical protein VIQ05_06020 [Tardiphaga sp.]